MMTTKKRATLADIIQHFHRLLGQDNVIFDATNLFASGETEQGIVDPNVKTRKSKK